MQENVTDKFSVEAFQNWQRLVEAWDVAERELEAIEAAPAGADANDRSQREAELRRELARLKQQIDELVQHISDNREKGDKDMLVALLDTKPEGRTRAEIVGERRPRPARRP